MEQAALEATFTPLGFDGVWSLLSRLLLQLHGESTISLDSNWVTSPQSFRCPVCNQSKVDLILPGPKGLRGILHLDHDHSLEAILVKAREIGVFEIPPPVLHRYSTYEPTLVCQPCNLLDARLKFLAPEIPEYFSFPPEQKRQLIKKPGKRQHQLSLKLAKSLWKAAKAGYLKKQRQIACELQDYIKPDGSYRIHDPRHDFSARIRERFQRICVKQGISLSFDDFLRRSRSIES